MMHANQYNLDYLKQVFQGNDAMVLRILDIFEEEVPKYFAEMSRLGNADLWGELHPLAHKAKSSIGMLGMQSLLQEVLVVENLSRTASDTADLKAALSRAQVQLELALAALRKDRACGSICSPKLGTEAPNQGAIRNKNQRLHRA
jgi:HPt (histidine-containing phosphotransfer) domain-containing protein